MIRGTTWYLRAHWANRAELTEARELKLAHGTTTLCVGRLVWPHGLEVYKESNTCTRPNQTYEGTTVDDDWRPHLHPLLTNAILGPCKD